MTKNKETQKEIEAMMATIQEKKSPGLLSTLVTLISSIAWAIIVLVGSVTLAWFVVELFLKVVFG